MHVLPGSGTKDSSHTRPMPRHVSISIQYTTDSIKLTVDDSAQTRLKVLQQISSNTEYTLMCKHLS